MQPNEDVPYGSVGGFATPDREEPIEKSTLNETIVAALKKNNTYIDAAIAEHLTIDVIDLGNDKMSPIEQVAVHKLVVHHLRQIGADIKELNSKVKELR